MKHLLPLFMLATTVHAVELNDFLYPNKDRVIRESDSAISCELKLTSLIEPNEEQRATILNIITELDTYESQYAQVRDATQFAADSRETSARLFQSASEIMHTFKLPQDLKRQLEKGRSVTALVRNYFGLAPSPAELAMLTDDLRNSARRMLGNDQDATEEALAAFHWNLSVLQQTSFLTYIRYGKHFEFPDDLLEAHSALEWRSRWPKVHAFVRSVSQLFGRSIH